MKESSEYWKKVVTRINKPSLRAANNKSRLWKIVYTVYVVYVQVEPKEITTQLIIMS